MSQLDTAFQASQAAPDDAGLQMAYYAAFSEAEVFLLLEAESDGQSAEPRTVDPGTGPMALAFDQEDRLASFMGQAAPFVAMSGKQLAEMLSEAGLGLAFNLETPFETAFDVETLAWVASVAGQTDPHDSLPIEVTPPKDMPEDLLEALDRKLAMAAGYASQAVLVDASYADGSKAHLLTVMDCAPEAEEPLVRAISEAMAFMGFGAGWLDVAFLDASSDLARRISSVGLMFELPEAGAAPSPSAPGLDPAKPPILR